MASQFYVVVSDDGTIESYASISRQNKREYAARHGYVFESHGLTTAVLNVYWDQVRILCDVLSRMRDGDWLFYSGADSVIVGMDTPLTEFTSPVHSLVITADEHGLNNGAFLLRANEWGRDYLSRVWELRGQTIYGYQEQGAFRLIAEAEDKRDGVLFIPQEMINAYDPAIYGDAYKPGLFLYHYPGQSTPARVRYMTERLR